MPPTPRVLKCRWCDYTVPAWYTQKNGRRRSGWGRLVEHVADHHAGEPDAARFLDRLDHTDEATHLAIIGTL